MASRSNAQDAIEESILIEFDSEHVGRRVAAVLASALPLVGRKEAKTMISAGQVSLDGRLLKKDTVLQAGQRLTVRGIVQGVIPNDSLPLNIAHEHADWLVINKPPNMACHPIRSAESGTAVNALLARYPEIRECGHSALEPGLVHRIDVDTSGLVLVARNAQSFARLTALLQSGDIYKEYLAICAGTPRAQTIAVPIGNHPTDKRRAAVQSEEDGGRAAHTMLIDVQRVGSYSVVRVRADRATRHQVRVHMAWIGHPLVGDVLYGGPPISLGRHLLHASCLAFSYESQDFSIHAPLPDDVLAFLGD